MKQHNDIPCILVIDDEPQIRRFIKVGLQASEMEIIEADSAASAYAAFEKRIPDLIILDLGLPDADGKEIIATLRQKSEVPIIVLSVRAQESEKIEALDLGADDYVTKPFGVGELMARIRAVLRSHMKKKGLNPVYRKGDLEIDLLKRLVLLKGEVIKLTRKEYNLLAYMAENAGRVLTHRMLLEHIWGPAHKDETQYLRVFIRQLRQKIEADAIEPQFIVTESGVGYRLMEPDPLV